MLSSDVNLAEVAQKCPVTLSGADLYALCADAWMLAFKQYIARAEQQQQQIEPLQPHSSSSGLQQLDQHMQLQNGVLQQGMAQHDSLEQQQPGNLHQQSSSEQIMVAQTDFLQALAALTPSLSADELARYLAIKQHYDSQQGFGQAQAPTTASSESYAADKAVLTDMAAATLKDAVSSSQSDEVHVSSNASSAAVDAAADSQADMVSGEADEVSPGGDSTLSGVSSQIPGGGHENAVLSQQGFDQ